MLRPKLIHPSHPHAVKIRMYMYIYTIRVKEQLECPSSVLYMQPVLASSHISRASNYHSYACIIYYHTFIKGFLWKAPRT